MPTYGYRCQSCKHEFERVQKITDPALTECEVCQGPVKKILYPVGIAFKGDGFYVNDYAKTTAKSPKSETASETETKTDAPKTETATAPASSETAAPATTTAPSTTPAPATPKP